MRRKVTRLLNRPAIELDNDVAKRTYPPSRQGTLSTYSDQCALASAQPNGLGHILADLIDLHANTPLRYFPADAQLLRHACRLVNRDRKGNPLKAAWA